MTELANYIGLPVIDQPCRIDLTFNFKAKSVASPRIGDLDNLMKAALDGLVKVGLLSDDRLVLESHSHKRATTNDDSIQIAAFFL